MIYKEEFMIRYTELDKNGKFEFTGLLKLLQEIGCLHTNQVNMGLNNIEETNSVWIVLNWKLKMYDTVRWNEKVTVKTWASGTQNHLYCYRDYEVYNSKGTLIAKATSKWVLTNATTGRIRKITDEIQDRFEQETTKVFTEEIEKLTQPEEGTAQLQYTVMRKDIDTNNHMNNINYLYIALETLPEEVYEKHDFNQIDILYKHACKLNENITGYYTKTKDSDIVTIKNEGKLNAIIKFSKTEN